jgi:hypothetical protein
MAAIVTDMSFISEPNQAKLFDALLRLDFIAFMQKAFETLNPNQKLKLNWHHEAIACCLEEVLNGNCRRLNINLPPRNLKSILISVALPAFLLGHDPSKRIICASYSQDLANKLSRDCRAVLQSAWYQRAFPKMVISDKHNTESDFTTTARGGRFTSSVGGMLTGRGANLIILDDVMKSQDATSDVARKSVIAWYSGTVVTRLDDKQSGAIINVAQRLHPDDLTGHLIEQGGWKTLSLPAIAVGKVAVPLIGGAFYRRQEGDVLHPEHEPLQVLREICREIGSRDF